LLTALILLASSVTICAQQASTSERDQKAINDAVQGWWTASMKTHDQRIAWWREAKFGCFIHWGVYSTFGGEWNGKPFRGYAEHMMRINKIPRAEYEDKVVSIFNPVKFNAGEWVRLIKSAGMKYVVITAKHHDGFAMFPSAVTRYNIRDATPFKRDPMRELRDACRRNGIRFGFYYSHAFDWEHPDAPGNDWDYDNPGGDKGLHGGVQWYDQHPDLLEKAKRYVDQKAIPQIVELLKNYQPDILWFDTPNKLPLSENIRIMKAARAADPNVVINGRLARGAGYSFGDYKNTGDRAAEIVPTEGDWETIPTTNESYGYHKYDLSHKPVSHFIQLMAKTAARGGNMLMNIGPMGDGLIDPKDQQILRGVGAWLKTNGESIYGSERTPLPVQAWGESTRKGNTLYLQVFDWPRNGKLVLGGLKSEIVKAYLIADLKHKALKTNRLNASDLMIVVPLQPVDSADTVVAVEVRSEPQVNPVRLVLNSQPNLLRVFDGELHGRKLHFGDGKASRAYVLDWSDPTEWVGWNIRVNEPGRYEVSVKYTTASGANNGTYSVTFNDQAFVVTVVPTPIETQARTEKVGTVRLVPGEYEIQVKPEDIRGGELMRLFSISLTPAGSAGTLARTEPTAPGTDSISGRENSTGGFR
jgi:alpha-L-fucosidase